MDCNECDRLERVFLESLVTADSAETALRCYLITHQQYASVSELDEYNSLRAEQQRTAGERHNAYMAVVEHRNRHS